MDRKLQRSAAQTAAVLDQEKAGLVDMLSGCSNEELSNMSDVLEKLLKGGDSSCDTHDNGHEFRLLTIGNVGEINLEMICVLAFFGFRVGMDALIQKFALEDEIEDGADGDSSDYVDGSNN